MAKRIIRVGLNGVVDSGPLNGAALGTSTDFSVTGTFGTSGDVELGGGLTFAGPVVESDFVRVPATTTGTLTTETWVQCQPDCVVVLPATATNGQRVVLQNDSASTAECFVSASFLASHTVNGLGSGSFSGSHFNVEFRYISTLADWVGFTGSFL